MAVLWPFKSVFITGCNRGIGLVLVKQLLNLSNPPQKIFATCRSVENASELKNLAAANSNLHLIEFDVTNFEGIKQVVLEVETKLEGQGLNLLINNAGIMDRSTLDQFTAERHDKCVQHKCGRPPDVDKGFTSSFSSCSFSKQQPRFHQDFHRKYVVRMLGSIANNTWSTMYPYRPSKDSA